MTIPLQAPVVTDETTPATQEASEPAVATMAAPTRGFVSAVGTWSAPPASDGRVSARDLALRALVVKYVADVATAAIKDRRAALADELANGDRVSVTAPDQPDLDLGCVLRTKPKGSAAVTDRHAFAKWMVTNYPERVQDVTAISTAHLGEAIQILREHAPYVLVEVATVTDWAEAEVLKVTERAKEPCGPGGELDVPGIGYVPPGPGVVTVRLSEDGPAAIEQLWREGRIDLISGEVLALPAALIPRSPE
jgi:hypothetical protein